MASLARLELVNKFRKELEDFNAFSALRAENSMDTTHIQMASLDEMMSAYGYVPRRLAKYPNINDGRFGYMLAFPAKGRPLHLSLEAAVQLHNGSMVRPHTVSRKQMEENPAVFARKNRIVETVSIQRNKRWGNDGSGIKSQTRWVKFLEEQNGQG